MTPVRRRFADAMLGALVGALFTSAVTAFTLYVEVKTMNQRLTALETTVGKITRVEVIHSQEGASFR